MFDSLIFEAKASYYENGKNRADKGFIKPVPLKIRLIEGITQQSSSWNKKNVYLSENFVRIELDIENDFDWSRDAWSNTQKVDKEKIIKIMFGHDSSVNENIRATIRIRNIRLISKI